MTIRLARQKVLPLFSMFWRCLRYPRIFAALLGSRVTDISKLWSISLFTRSIVALNSAIILIKERANDGAAILVRTLFEIEFQLGAIKADPGIAARLIKATGKFRGGRLRALIESKHELPQGITEEAVREQLDIAGSIGAANVNIIELAEKAGLSYEYKRFIRYCVTSHMFRR